MDLTTITAIASPRSRAELPVWQKGDAWLAGGTWLFSEPQPALTRLIDLSRLGWPPHEIDETGLTLAGTCTIAQLDRLEAPAEWVAAPLIGQCCRALLGSFKIWNTATVGGNLCAALPAGPMISLAAALDGLCAIWAPDGSERRVSVLDVVTGARETALEPGDILRSVHMPVAALRRRAAFRRVSLSPNGRSGALLIGSLDASGGLLLTVTASTRRPLRLAFDGLPSADGLRRRLGADIPPSLWHDDVHGAPDWRAHVTGLLAEEIRAELSEGAGA